MNTVDEFVSCFGAYFHVDTIPDDPDKLIHIAPALANALREKHLPVQELTRLLEQACRSRDVKLALKLTASSQVDWLQDSETEQELFDVLDAVKNQLAD